jgi:hypothetical protein
MSDLTKLIFSLVLDLFRSRTALEAEVLVLRQQIIVLRRGRVGRLPFSATNRLVLGWVMRVVFKCLWSACHHPARDGDALASRRLPIVLALEVQVLTGPSRGVG